jgi:hypothetical protein
LATFVIVTDPRDFTYDRRTKLQRHNKTPKRTKHTPQTPTRNTPHNGMKEHTDTIKSSNLFHAMNSTTIAARHACEIEIQFPTADQADQVMKVLQVDKEPTDRVVKSFRLIQQENGDTAMRV